MPTNTKTLYHITNPIAAGHIIRHGVFYHTEYLMEADQCMNMLDASVWPLNAVMQGQQRYELSGVVLEFEWNGEERSINQWRNDLQSNVLYHQSYGALSTPPFDTTSYWRSFVVGGTRQCLRLTAIHVMPNSFREEWREGNVYARDLGLWALVPKWLRSLCAEPAGNTFKKRLSTRIGFYGIPVTVTAPKKVTLTN